MVLPNEMTAGSSMVADDTTQDMSGNSAVFMRSKKKMQRMSSLKCQIVTPYWNSRLSKQGLKIAKLIIPITTNLPKLLTCQHNHMKISQCHTVNAQFKKVYKTP